MGPKSQAPEFLQLHSKAESCVVACVLEILLVLFIYFFFWLTLEAK